MQTNNPRPINIEAIQELVNFCVHEIALQGLEGCRLTELFSHLHKSISLFHSLLDESTNSSPLQIYNFISTIVIPDTDSTDDINLSKNFLWKLLVNQNDLEFFEHNKTEAPNLTKPSTKSVKKKREKSTKPESDKSSLIINDRYLNRGYCTNYFERTPIDKTTLNSYEECLTTYSENLIILASQEQRNRILCPSHKCLDFENISDIEYCVLETVAKSRYNGVFTAGEEGLAKKFNLSSKQLHYILIMLEEHGLIKKQVLKSAQQRSIIYLFCYAFKNKTLVENVCDYLMQKGDDKNECQYADSFVGVKRKFSFTNKQFKTLVQHGERLGLFKRFILPVRSEVKNNGKWVTRVRETRMLKLSDYQIAILRNVESNEVIGDDSNEPTEESPNNEFSIPSIGIEQVNTLPLFTQIMAKIEISGREGISLKKLGNVFGFDFYKSRRLGQNLQTHPELVTIMKETNGGRAKFQNLVMRKFLKLNPAVKTETNDEDAKKMMEESANLNETSDINSSINMTQNETLDQSVQDSSLLKVQPELVIIKRDNGSSKTIQALMSDRSVTRKKIILNYLEKHQICTKYEIDKEIRSIEAENGLKGCIDSKTTKRMLLALEKESKLKTFTVNLKNISYMGVHLWDIKETDSVFVNYSLTFKRTFDSVELKIGKNAEDTNVENGKDSAGCPPTSNPSDKPDSYQNYFQLTRQFVNSVVSKLHFSNNNCKAYSLVPKFQKAIVLHRFLHYIIFFYDGQSQASQQTTLTQNTGNQHKEWLSVETDDLVDSCELPSMDKTFQPIGENGTIWSTYIPPLNKSTKQSNESNCIFIGEIFSHMPLSVFCSLIAINHYVPGLLRLLKHPQKRHILVKDLPPELIAPLIFERRYLRRILGILHILACLGLITFVNSPCNTNQASNRDAQAQMIYVHRKALFLDTSINKATNWQELTELNKSNIQTLTCQSTNTNEPAAQEDQKNEKKGTLRYEKCLFEFNGPIDVVDYWHRLLHVSMNTFKFNVQSYLHEDKRVRSEHLNKILMKIDLAKVVDLWPIDQFGDHMGPGGYSSQLFLNSFKNWMLSSNVCNYSDNRKNNQTNELAITKEAELYRAPYSELALSFPFGVFRGIASANNESTRSRRKRRQVKNDLDASDTENEMDEESPKKSKKKQAKLNSKQKCAEGVNDQQSSTKAVTTNEKNFKFVKARSLLVRAKTYRNKTSSKTNQTCSTAKNTILDRRAIWQSEEDELILLIKVAAHYFIPNEKYVPFKLINDVMNELVPHKCKDKKISSFGRRIKNLLKSNMNLLFVQNKLELCKQSRRIQNKYGGNKGHIKNTANREQVELYLNFVNDIKEWFLKKKNYTDGGIDYDADEEKFELPDTMEEFKRRFVVKNTPGDQLPEKRSYFKQPKSDYEISCNTLHSAIHSSILINDKNPRVYESFNLFDKYSDQLLTDVIFKMSRDHKIIAPTKCSELKKKNVTSFSKHIGKAYHISQRYQYKWINNISSSVLNETHKFKGDLVKHMNKVDDNEEMFDCTDNDDVGTTSFLAHTIEISDSFVPGESIPKSLDVVMEPIPREYVHYTNISQLNVISNYFCNNYQASIANRCAKQDMGL